MLNTFISVLIILVITWSVSAQEALPDPTRPANYSSTLSLPAVLPKKGMEFNVNAIRISKTDRSAIVNGIVVREGDEINSAIVKEISELQVLLAYERKLLPVPLYKQGVIKQFKEPVE